MQKTADKASRANAARRCAERYAVKIHIGDHMKKLILVSLLILTSCAAYDVGRKSGELNSVSIGMTKTEVIAQIGQPSRVSANGGVEFLIYRLVDDVNYEQSVASLGLIPPATKKSDYFVKLIANKVVSYGKVGDFGTTIEAED